MFFERADATKRDYSNAGVLFANPPYGERLLDLQQAEKLYADLGRATKNSPMKQYLLSSDPLFERCYGRKADKRRKLYNGMIKCCICILKTRLHRTGERISTPTDRLLNGRQNAERYRALFIICSENFCENSGLPPCILRLLGVR